MKLCLIGSTRFMERYMELNRALTLAGHVVYSVATASTEARGNGENPLSEDEKETLDLVHLRKIQESDAVLLVTDETGYVGFSTKRELKWASMNDKAVFLTEDELKYQQPVPDYDVAKEVRRRLKELAHRKALEADEE